MAVNQIIVKSEGLVHIPIVWTKTICGSKARIVYDKTYGIIDMDSIPVATVKVVIKGNQIFFGRDCSTTSFLNRNFLCKHQE